MPGNEAKLMGIDDAIYMLYTCMCVHSSTCTWISFWKTKLTCVKVLWLHVHVLMGPGIGRNVSRTLSDWLTSRPGGCSQPSWELMFSYIMKCTCTCGYVWGSKAEVRVLTRTVPLRQSRNYFSFTVHAAATFPPPPTSPSPTP